MSFADELRGNYIPRDELVKRDTDYIVGNAVGALMAACKKQSVKKPSGRVSGYLAFYYDEHFLIDDWSYRDINGDRHAETYFYMPDPSIDQHFKANKRIIDRAISAGTNNENYGLPWVSFPGAHGQVLTRDQARQAFLLIRERIDKLGFTSAVVRFDEVSIPIDRSEGTRLSNMMADVFSTKLPGFVIYLEASW